MDIVFMGSPDFAVESLDKLIKSDFINLKGVVTQPDRKRGRGQKLKPTPVKKLAQKNDIEVYQPSKISTEIGVKKLNDWNPDLIIVVAYGQILSKEVLEVPDLGCVNLHASLLPKYRGAAPIHQAVINGDQKSGVTTMFMEEELDSGPMLLKAEVEITAKDTAGSLHDKLATQGADLLVETIKKLANDEIKPKEQDHSQASYAPKLDKDDCEIDWQASAKAIWNKIRGLNPWPGAYTYYNGERFKLWQSKFVKDEASASKVEAGTIIKLDENEGILVQTGKGQLLLTEVQPPSRKKISAADYIKGYEIEVGNKLGE